MSLKGCVGIAFVVAFFSIVAYMLWNCNSFVLMAPQHLPCVPVALPADVSEFAGAEDITIDADNGIAFLSVCDFHTLLVSGKTEDGGIFIYDLANNMTDPQQRLHRLQPIGMPSDLSIRCPHGIGLWPLASASHPELGSKKYLFVTIMHGTAILKFEYNHATSEESEKHKLFFVEAFSNSQYLISPNDIIPISPRKFYFTNDHPTTNIFCQLLQDLLPQFFGNANVVLFDGVEPIASSEDIQGTNRQDEWKVVIDGLQFANGINVSPDNKYLYVSETTGKRVSVYKRRGISGSGDVQVFEDHANLSLVQHIFVDSNVDNIEVDSHGALWVGAQLGLLSTIQYLFSPKYNHAPSEVFRITLHEREPLKVEELEGGDNSNLLLSLDAQVEQVFYDDDGCQISASSVGAYYKGHLLIGSIAGHHFLDCFL